jgi:hypothetical protein
MSSVVLALECRICACASFTLAPTIFSQVACEVRRHRQFTQGIPSARPAGLRNRVRMLSSRIGRPFGPTENQVVRFVVLHRSRPWAAGLEAPKGRRPQRTCANPPELRTPSRLCGNLEVAPGLPRRGVHVVSISMEFRADFRDSARPERREAQDQV